MPVSGAGKILKRELRTACWVDSDRQVNRIGRAKTGTDLLAQISAALGLTVLLISQKVYRLESASAGRTLGMHIPGHD
jgi:hypothetical protein